MDDHRHQSRRNAGVFLEANEAIRPTHLVVPQYKKVSRSRCQLLRQTWEKQWTGVVERCATHPDEACCISEDTGQTALHLASFSRACPQFVAEALIEVNPHALFLEDPRLGWTPLHHLCAFPGGNDHLVPLYCAKIQSLEPDLPSRNILQSKDPSPLCLASERNAPLSTFDALVRTRRCSPWIGPKTGGELYYAQDSYENVDKSPLQILAEKYDRAVTIACANEVTLRKMKAVTIRVFELSTDVADAVPDHAENALCDADTCLLWEKCMLLLCEGSRDAYRLPNGSSSPVHITCGLAISCPHVAQACLDMFQAFALDRDAAGLIPLHHVLLHNSSEVLLKVLLSRAPASALIPLPDGSSPILVGLRKGISWDDGLEWLVKLGPDALKTPDSPNSLYPPLVAAALNADLNTIYNLVRFSPEFIKQCRE